MGEKRCKVFLAQAIRRDIMGRVIELTFQRWVGFSYSGIEKRGKGYEDEETA